MESAIFSLEKLWEESINKAVEILRVENVVELGVLTVESNTKLPAEGFKYSRKILTNLLM